MLASSVEMAVPLRAITTKFVKSGPSSRSTTAVRMGPMSAVWPNRVSQYCACTTTKVPTMSAMSATNPVASSPVKRIWRASTLRSGAVQSAGRSACVPAAQTMAAVRAARPSRASVAAPIWPNTFILRGIIGTPARPAQHNLRRLALHPERGYPVFSCLRPESSLCASPSGGNCCRGSRGTRAICRGARSRAGRMPSGSRKSCSSRPAWTPSCPISGVF